MAKQAPNVSKRGSENGPLFPLPVGLLVVVATMVIAMALESWAQRVVYR